METLVSIKPNKDIDPDIKQWLDIVYQENGFCAGGYCRWLVSPHSDINYGDIDIFCMGGNIEEAEINFSNIHKALSKDLKETYDNWVGVGLNKDRHNIQIIRPRAEGKLITFGNPINVINQFDYTITQIFYDIIMDCVWSHPSLIEDETKHKLVITSIQCPLASIQRLIKYSKKGYRMSLSEILKIFEEWDLVDSEEKQTWKEGLNNLSSIENKEESYGELLKKLRFID